MSTTIKWTPKISIPKDPQAVKWYEISGEDLLGTGVEFAVADCTVTVTRQDGVDMADDASPLVADQLQAVAGTDGRIVTFRVSGGTIGVTYIVTFHHQTDEAAPQQDDHSIRFAVAQR